MKVSSVLQKRWRLAISPATHVSSACYFCWTKAQKIMLTV